NNGNALYARFASRSCIVRPQTPTDYRVMDLIVSRPEGLYCPPGDFYIDPWRPVARAVITHGHSDHARWGSASYLCHADSVPILRHRLGEIRAQGVAYGEVIDQN